MKRQLQDLISKVSAGSDTKQETNSGKVLDNLKVMDAQVRAAMASKADAHGARAWSSGCWTRLPRFL